MRLKPWFGLLIVVALAVLVAALIVSRAPNTESVEPQNTESVEPKAMPAKENAVQRAQRSGLVFKEGRSTKEIMSVFKQNSQERSYAIYNAYLLKGRHFDGKITVKFSILPSGDVENGEIVASTTGYPEFDKAILEDLLQWKFEKGDYAVSTLTLPLAFSK